MRYIIIDQTKTDWFTEEYDSREEAVKEAQDQWDRLTEPDRKRREAFYVLESVNPDEEAENHLDGNTVWEAKQ